MREREVLPESVSRHARLAHVDLVRVVAVLAVVAGHIYYSHTMRLIIYTWHVPFFFFISGYLWRTGRRGVVAEITVRKTTLLKPYLVWLILGGSYWCLEQILAGYPISDHLMELALGGKYLGMPLTAFWFITALFFSCIMYRGMDKFSFCARSVLSFCALSLGVVFGPELASAPLSVGTSITCVFFIWAGEAFKRIESKIPPSAGPFALLGAGLLLYLLNASLDLKQGEYGTPFVSAALAVVVCVGLLCSASWLVPRLSSRFLEWVSQMAVVALGVIMCHSIVLWTVLAGFNIDHASFTLAVGLFVVTCITTWGGSLLISKTKFGPYLLGN